MDNRMIDITSEGDEALDLALQIIWPNVPGGKASHYKIVRIEEVRSEYGYVSYKESEEGEQTLILLWSNEKDSLPLPYPMDLEAIKPFLKNWLNSVEYDEEPDIDGSCRKAWRLFTDNWGHVADHHYGIVGVQPSWAMIGK